MKYLATVIAVLLLGSMGYAQFTESGYLNAYDVKNNWTGPDSTMPYRNDQGVRTVFVTNDLDGDGKQEILATDYSNGGRLHVLEMTSPGVLEIVWSSPKMYDDNANSTPRWAEAGDMDADGMPEIIFPAGSRYGGAIYVFEWTGVDNDYGTTPALVLPFDQFEPNGTGTLRLDRERGTVYDFDGDGRDELITCFADSRTYIIGVVGDIGGFGSWQLEGGDPGVVPDGRFSGGSWWHSVPADIDGDGMKEIVNHYWNFYGWWSIDPVGPDAYRYPTPGVDSATVDAAKTQFYHEYFSDDAVSYMGVTVADVDGDGKDELAGVTYVSSTSPLNYEVVLTSLTTADTGVYVWKDSTQFGVIATDLWQLAGLSTGSHWGHGAYDFNENGRDELIIGGSGLYNLVAVEHNGSGSVLDPANYTSQIVYPGDPAQYHVYHYYDSLGIAFDTVRSESPFLSKLFCGADLDGDGAKEVVMAYQSVADSITYTRSVWDPNATPLPTWKDSTWKELNTNVFNIKVVEYTGATGFRDMPLTMVTPEDYVLEQNYPNPFNPETTIRFTLPVAKQISLVIYDMLGKEVRTLIGGELFQPGTHQVRWDGTNNSGHSVASGNYVYTLKFGNFTKTAKMTLLR